MTQGKTSFPAGIDFESVLQIVSKQVYETPLAFVRENVQNAVDAIRIQASRDRVLPSESRYRIDVTVDERKIIVCDNGIGMSSDDLRNFFWTIGASGKRTPEAKAAGCVGTFGIGGFANFGVCETLEVISHTEGEGHGTLTRLSEGEIRASGTSSPSVTMEVLDAAISRGTVVTGQLRNPANVEQIRSYLWDFIRFVPMAVYFNGRKISQSPFYDVDDRENLTEIGEGIQEWHEGDMVLAGRLFEDRGHTLTTQIERLSVNGEDIHLMGQLRFQNGPINVFKRGFKLCATQLGSTIGVSGRLDCDRFVPTAGRDSPDSGTTNLLSRIVRMLERVAVEKVLESPERIAQHTRIFQYVIRRDLVAKLGMAEVRLGDGSVSRLKDIRRKAEGGVGVFFGIAQKQALNQIMQARGHLVIVLSSDRYRREAERRYLEDYCAAKTFDGMIDCIEHYTNLSQFEKIFLSEIEMSISKSYEIEKFTLIAGKLSEDIPVFLKEQGSAQQPDIFIDVRHQEIAKLENLGYTPILYSLIGTFCWEYLGPSLKKWSPRFFGDGALNLELLAKRRSELWVLVKEDIGVLQRSGQHQIVTRADVQQVDVGVRQGQPAPSTQKADPRILHIVDEQGATGIGGFYIRVLDAAFRAYGDLIAPCETRGIVWTGNKITFSASDTVSAAFQYETRLDELVIAEVDGSKRAEGAIELKRPFQEIFGSLYFPIPTLLVPFLVPSGAQEIRLHLHCEWIDMRTAKQWVPKERPI